CLESRSRISSRPRLVQHGGNSRAKLFPSLLRLWSVMGEDAVEQAYVGRHLRQPVFLCVERAFGRCDQKSQDQSRDRSDESHSQLHHVPRILTQVMFRQERAENRPHQRAAKNDGENDPANSNRTHESSQFGPGALTKMLNDAWLTLRALEVAGIYSLTLLLRWASESRLTSSGVNCGRSSLRVSLTSLPLNLNGTW